MEICTKCNKPIARLNTTSSAELCICNAFTVQLQGWMCPRCKTIHSPFKSSCECSPFTVTTGGSTNYNQL